MAVDQPVLAPHADAHAAHGHGHHGTHAHHFDNWEQQRGAERLGMWMFLATEVLFFGGVMAAYTVYRLWYPAEFEAGSSKLNPLIATINSVLLLTSSLTITLAIYATRLGDQKRLVRMLGLTILLGVAFLGFKAYEYSVDYHENLIPGPNFTREFDETSLNPQHVQLFFMFYYIMTGLHVVHMLAGIGVLVYLFVRAYRNAIAPDKYVAIEVTSLYWHFVDIVWMFLLPLLYLAGQHHSLTH
jgi:cytochrome c oxidase subunit III